MGDAWKLKARKQNPGLQAPASGPLGYHPCQQVQRSGHSRSDLNVFTDHLGIGPSYRVGLGWELGSAFLTSFRVACSAPHSEQWQGLCAIRALQCSLHQCIPSLVSSQDMWHEHTSATIPVLTTRGLFSELKGIVKKKA